MCNCSSPLASCSNLIDDCGDLRIEDEGTLLPRERFLNFKGSGITAVDNNAAHRTDVTVIGAGTQSTFDVTGPITGNTNYDTTIADGDDIGIAIIIGRDGGAIVKQGSSPGTEQASSNFNISGTGTAKHALVAGDGIATSDDLLSVRNDDPARNTGYSFAAIQGIGNGAPQQDPVAQLRFGNDAGTPQASLGLYSTFGGTELWEDPGTVRLRSGSTFLFSTNDRTSGQVDADGSLFTLAHETIDTNFHRFCHFDSGGAGQIGVTGINDVDPPDLSIWHGSTNYINSAGNERLRITVATGDPNGVMLFGGVTEADQGQNPANTWQFKTPTGSNGVLSISGVPADVNNVKLSLHSQDSANNGLGVQIAAFAKVAGSEDMRFYTGGGEQMRIIGDGDSEDSNVIIGNVSIPGPPVDDVMKATLFWTATDSGNNQSNVSVGIELPNSVAQPGNFVVRTGGTGAAGSGTDHFRIAPLQAFFTFPSGQGQLTVATLDTPSGTVGIELDGTDSNGASVSAALATLDSSDGVLGLVAGSNPGSGPTLFIARVAGNGRAVFDTSNNGYSTPLAAFEVRAVDFDNVPAFFANSASGISALFQTSATDGSDANPTAVFAGNTNQTSSLTDWRARNGTDAVISTTWGTKFGGDFLSFAWFNNTFPLFSFGPTPVTGQQNAAIVDTSGGSADGLSLVSGYTDDSNFALTLIGGSGVTRTQIGTFAGAQSLSFGSIDVAQSGTVVALVNGGAQLTLANDADGSGVTAPGNVDAASYSVASTPGGTDTFAAGGKTWTFTNGLFISAV